MHNPNHYLTGLIDVKHGGVSCSALPLLALLDNVIYSMLFIGSIPALFRPCQVVQTWAASSQSIKADDKVLQGDLQSDFVALLLVSIEVFACFQLSMEQPLGR